MVPSSPAVQVVHPGQRAHPAAGQLAGVRRPPAFEPPDEEAALLCLVERLKLEDFSLERLHLIQTAWW
jgi:hypothetical protein